MIKCLNNLEVKVVKELNIKDKDGTWVQIEYLEGKLKGTRVPVVKEKLMKEKKLLMKQKEQSRC